jgi:hypothetical protein
MQGARAARGGASRGVSARSNAVCSESVSTTLSVMADLLHHEPNHRFAESHEIPGEIPGFRNEKLMYPETAHFRTETCHLAV